MSVPSENEKGKEFWSAATQGSAWYKPKTKFRISIPPSEKFKLLNLAEISAPAGMTITFKLPFPMGEAGMGKLAESIKSAGGTFEAEQ